MNLTLREDPREGVNLMPFQPVFPSRERTDPSNMKFVRVAAKILAKH